MTNTRTTHSLLLTLVGLVVGLTAALSIPIAHSVSGTLSAGQGASKAAPKAKTSVVACITKKRVIRSAGRSSGCPKGTKRKLVSIRGPKGKPGPGASAINLTMGPSATTFVLLGAGINFGCRSGANHVVLGLSSATATVRGMTIRDNAGENQSQPWINQGTRTGGTFMIGEFTGRNSTGAKISHLSVSTRWTGSACEVIGTLTPTK